MDNGTDEVYQYTAAASRTAGSQSAAATFALNPYGTNPQGIADPPPPDMMLAQTSTLVATPPPALVYVEAGSLGYAARPLDSALWNQVMSAMQTSDSLFPLPSTRGDQAVALDLGLGRVGGLDYAEANVKAHKPASASRRITSSSAEMLDAAVLDQVFADMI